MYIRVNNLTQTPTTVDLKIFRVISILQMFYFQIISFEFASKHLCVQSFLWVETSQCKS